MSGNPAPMKINNQAESSSSGMNRAQRRQLELAEKKKNKTGAKDMKSKEERYEIVKKFIIETLDSNLKRLPQLDKLLLSLADMLKCPVKQNATNLDYFLKEGQGLLVDRIYEPDCDPLAIRVGDANTVPLDEGATSSGIFITTQAVVRTEVNATLVALREAYQAFITEITDNNPVHKMREMTISTEKYAEIILDHAEAQVTLFYGRQRQVFLGMLDRLAKYGVSVKRQKNLSRNIEQIQSILQKLTTDHPLLEEISSDVIFLKGFSTLRYRVVKDEHYDPKNPNRKCVSSRVNYSAVNESGEMCIRMEEISHEELTKFHEIFFEIESKYSAYIQSDDFKKLKKEADNPPVNKVPTPVSPTENEKPEPTGSPKSEEPKPTVATDEKPKEKGRAPLRFTVAPVSASSSSSVVVRTFAGMKIDFESVGEIRKTMPKKYFYLDMLALEGFPLGNFMNLAVKMAADQGEAGLKPFGQKIPIRVSIQGKEHKLFLCYELKHMHETSNKGKATDRILCVEIPCDQGGSSLIVGLIGVDGGLHDGKMLEVNSEKVYVLNLPQCSRVGMTQLQAGKVSEHVNKNK